MLAKRRQRDRENRQKERKREREENKLLMYLRIEHVRHGIIAYKRMPNNIKWKII